MKFDLMRGNRVLACVLVSLVSVSTGCKTTNSWMPSGKMFSWNREPDPSLLASESEGYPQSPASKYEPNSVAAINAQQSTGTTGALATQTSPYGASTTMTPQAGLAAQSNGYQTGPYQTGASPYGSNAYGSTAAAGSAPMQQSPYGGVYSGASAPGSTGLAASQPTAGPTSAGSANGYPAPAGYSSPGGYTASPSGSGLPTGTGGLAQRSGAGLPAMPVSGSTQLPTASNPAIGNGTLPGGVGAVGLPNSSNIGVSPGAASGLPTSAAPTFGGAATFGGAPALGAGASASPTAPTAYKGATALGGFSPGTTGRSTGYDFGAGPAGDQAGRSASTTLPPNTANTGNPLLR